VESLRVPVIAAIQRACMGAGLELALCCDVRLAAEGTLFSIPEVQLGLVPDMGGTQRLPRTVGIGKAKELIYSARRFDAAEALRIGLVQAVHPAGELGARVAELAAEIAANAPLAVQAAKRAINGTYYGAMRSWLDWETAQASGPLLSEDRKVGLKAAAERKRADFKGK
jgi:enoyl-CoA hydratase